MVYLSARGHSYDVAGPFDLAEGEVMAGLEFVNRPAAAVRVRVLDPMGAPVDGAGVFVTGTGPYSDGVVARHDAGYHEIDGRGYYDANLLRRTEDGVATIERLPAGRTLRLAAVHPEFLAITGEELVLADGVERELVLRFAAWR